MAKLMHSSCVIRVLFSGGSKTGRLTVWLTSICRSATAKLQGPKPTAPVFASAVNHCQLITNGNI